MDSLMQTMVKLYTATSATYVCDEVIKGPKREL